MIATMLSHKLHLRVNPTLQEPPPSPTLRIAHTRAPLYNRLSCAQVGPNPRYGLTLDFLSIDNYRAIGPTRPPHTRGHPW